MRKYLHDGKRPRSARPSKLDAFKPYLRERPAAHARLQASVLCRKIRERGYDGCESQVRVAGLKPQAPSSQWCGSRRAWPADAGDYAEFHHGEVTVYAFVATLGFSRRLVVRFVHSLAFESLREVLRLCLESV